MPRPLAVFLIILLLLLGVHSPLIYGAQTVPDSARKPSFVGQDSAGQSLTMPNETRANHDKKVGHITPVGAYPAGATPEGLMDIGGNVWEWMENWYEKDKDAHALRGGSWDDDSAYLRCAARDAWYPVLRDDVFGFRVVCAQSSFDTLKL